MREIRITGVKVAYYYICHTKLWLFSHDIAMEREHENVEVGRLIHETSYGGREPVTIDEIAVDFIRRGDLIEVHEVKKTRSMERAHRMQLLYYLYYLRERGVEAVGVIDYPKLRRRERVELSEGDAEELERAMEEIRRINDGPMPPPRRKKICRKCAYYEFCFGGEDE